MKRAVPLAEVTREDVTAGGSWREIVATGSGRGVVATGSGRELVESSHVGHLVVVGAGGEVTQVLGDPERVTFVRSTAKPFQATACLELLGDAADELSPEEIALSWASHRGEGVHVATAHRLLGRSGTAPEALTCPPAAGEDDPSARPQRVLHNCSGKHALFALAGGARGIPRKDLLDLDGPLQRVLLGVVEDALGTSVAVGVDGCGAPAVAVPLVRLAAAFAAFATEDRWRRVREAGFAAPHLVGGTGRLETALLGAGIVAKVGAEGVFAAGWRAPDGSPRGVAVKAEDGAERAATVAVHAVLVAAGAVAPDVWQPAPVLGGGAPVGRVRAVPPPPAG